MARLYLSYPIKLLSIISQLEGSFHSLIVAVIHIAAVSIQRSLNGHNFEFVGVGAIAVIEITLCPEKTHATIA